MCWKCFSKLDDFIKFRNFFGLVPSLSMPVGYPARNRLGHGPGTGCPCQRWLPPLVGVEYITYGVCGSVAEGVSLVQGRQNRWRRCRAWTRRCRSTPEECGRAGGAGSPCQYRTAALSPLYWPQAALHCNNIANSTLKFYLRRSC